MGPPRVSEQEAKLITMKSHTVSNLLQAPLFCFSKKTHFHMGQMEYLKKTHNAWGTHTGKIQDGSSTRTAWSRVQNATVHNA